MNATDEPDSEEERAEHVWQSRPVRWSAAAGLLTAIGFLLEHFDGSEAVATGLFVAAALSGMRFFAIEAVKEVWQEREIGIELLMTVAALTAGALGLWEEAAMLAFLYSISEALEEFTEDRTRGAIRALMDLAPKRVRLIDAAGTQSDIDIEDLQVGQRFLVRPGESIATDGTVIEGESSVNEAAVTGESLPISKQPESKVFAGTLNEQGALTIEATAAVGDNTLARIVQLVSEAQEQKGAGEQFMTRFARRYSPAVLATGVLIAVIGGLIWNWADALERAATVLVAAAPCALVISIPVTYVAAMGRGSRRGILIKGGIHLEELAKVRVIALDKTGTVTSGVPAVVANHPANDYDSATVLSLAAAIEQRSEHPLARAIVRAAAEEGTTTPAVDEFTSLPGAGASATIAGSRYVIGSPTLMSEQGHSLTEFEKIIEDIQSSGATAVVLADDEQVVGVLGVADTVRPAAAKTIQRLHSAGVEQVVMLTGDNQRTAEAIASQVGIDDVRADLKPADKAKAIASLQAAGGHVAMVGDGVNDAPALAAAEVGIAMGAAGSDVALETADVALMSDDLAKLPEAIELGRRTRTIVKQNLGLSLAILVVLVPGALFGLLTLPVAVLAHELTELAVILNGARMARGSKTRE